MELKVGLISTSLTDLVGSWVLEERGEGEREGEEMGCNKSSHEFPSAEIKHFKLAISRS